jgi:hypothetical protein
MKGLIFLISMATAAGTGYMIYKDHKKDGCLPGLEVRIAPTDDKVKTDLMNKPANLANGQQWLIANGQQIEFKTVDRRICRTGQISIYGNVSATADIGSVTNLNGILKDSSKDGATKAVFEGLVKIDYENVNGQWYYAGMTNLDAKVTVR